jgi:hypothetical protein
MKAGLPVAPARIARRPLDERGFPIPWFVATVDGKPDFRVVDTGKWLEAVKHFRCWVCGEPMGRNYAFPIGPMCAVNRVTSEPGCHFECAVWSAEACPFLSQPRMRRNERNLPDGIQDAAGFPLDRNPGGCVVYVTRSFEVFKAQNGNSGRLIQLGAPEGLVWFTEGRRATRAEVLAMLERGIPALREVAAQEGDAALAACERMYDVAVRTLVPA